MEDYKVSVIVAAYNIQDYIVKCLESIENQTYKNLEVIIVDDGSSDNTGKLADEFAENDNRFTVIHKENVGVSSARNRGIDIASGDFIGFVDGDDTIEVDMYEILVNNAIKYDADISHCGYKLIENNKETLMHGSGQVIIQDRKKGIVDLMDGSLIEPAIWNKIFRKEIVGDTRLDESLKINEDLYFNILLFNKSRKSIFEDKAKYNYIKRDNSATTSSSNNIVRMTDPRKVYKMINDLYKDDEVILPYAEKMDLLRNVNIYNLLTLENGSDFIELKQKVRNYIKLNKRKMKKNELISKKSRCMVYSILYLQYLYDFIYRTYFKKKYINN